MSVTVYVLLAVVLAAKEVLRAESESGRWDVWQRRLTAGAWVLGSLAVVVMGFRIYSWV